MGDSGEELAVAESRKLFVGSLSHDTTDDGVRHFFNRFGEVESAQVMRDKFTNQSRGFGFVVFLSAEDAKVVLEQPELRLDNSVLKPALAQPRGATRRSGGGPGGRSGGYDAGGRGESGGHDTIEKLYVGGLSYDTDDRSFRAHFEQFGEVQDCVVMRNRETQRSRGFGFVTFAKHKGLEKCLSESREDGSQVLDSREISVKLAVPKDIMRAVDEEKHRARVSGLDESQAKKIFVKGLDSSSTEADFVGFFRRFGGVSEAFLVRDRMTKQPRGFGFITFETFDSAVHVLHTQTPLVLNGKHLTVTRAQPKDGPRDGGYGPMRDSPRRGGYSAPPPRGSAPGRGPPRGADPYYDDRAPPARGPRGYDDRAPRAYERGSARDSYAPPPRERAPRGGYASARADPYPARGGDSYARDSYAPPPERDSYHHRESRAAAGGDSYGRAARAAPRAAPRSAPRGEYGGRDSYGASGASYAEPDYAYDAHAPSPSAHYGESRGSTSYASPASGTSRSYKAYYDDPRSAEAPPRAHVRDSGYSSGAAAAGGSSYDRREGGGGYSHGGATNGSSRAGSGYRESGARSTRYRPY